ncbi:hypothetical protein H4W32_004683 [Actinophytocola algeriensis]|uniref:Uncharacterized protein n=1 Tax=Actinophytocola algeriensis TaxID=1768010 RepID=A0A7W7VBZ5_9PSEU|nr:hypothetical protein [Actinophytocola algeriensis]MBE1476641.1 hypothetical protein [Actinophytocola algeriensis]
MPDVVRHATRARARSARTHPRDAPKDPFVTPGAMKDPFVALTVMKDPFVTSDVMKDPFMTSGPRPESVFQDTKANRARS